VTWQRLDPAQEIPLVDGHGRRRLGLRALAAPGKVALHLEGAAAPGPLDNVGLVIRDDRSRKSLAYVSASAGLTPELTRALEAADCVFFDGTFWSEDELVDLGLGRRRASQMAHLPIGGPSGSLAALAGLSARKIYIHINHTNPILREDSPERAAVAAAGWEVAEDGLEVIL
jgi:pyrroloquinoline quinone biosynthesis protein B